MLQFINGGDDLKVKEDGEICFDLKLWFLLYKSSSSVQCEVFNVMITWEFFVWLWMCN